MSVNYNNNEQKNMEENKLFYLKNGLRPFSFDLQLKRNENDSVIVFDCGSYRCRAGWSNEVIPSFSFPPIVATPNIQRKKITLVGNNIENYLPISSEALKTPFNKNVVCDFNLMENIFDYTFDNLKLEKGENTILLTEPFSNPSLSRNAMTEILFETYGFKNICFGVDFLFSHFYNSFSSKNINSNLKNKNSKKDDLDTFIDKFYRKSSEMLISCSHDFTHILNLNKIDNLKENDYSLSYRLPIGSKTILIYLEELFKLSHPHLKGHISEKTLFEILKNHCYTAEDFDLELESIAQNEKEKTVSLKFDEKSIKNDFFEKVFNKDGFSVKQIKSYRHLEITRQLSQLLNWLVWGKDRLTIEYSEFLKLINELGIKSEEDLNKINFSIKENLKQCESKYSDLIKVFTGGFGRVKTRERSRKQKLSKSKKIRLNSNIENGINELKTKYWNGSELITKNIYSLDQFRDALKDFKINSKKNFQLDLSNELIRGPEVLFKPNLVGYADQGGIGDCINELMLNRVNLPNKIFITGGAAKIKHFSNRIRKEVRQCYPVDKNFEIILAEDPIYDAWKGARLFSKSNYFETNLSNIDSYKEKGFENLYKEHLFSNKYGNFPTDLMGEYEF